MTDDVHKAIKTRIKTLGYPVAWENRKYVPTEGVPWIRSKFMPVDAKAAAIGSSAERRETGVHFITVFAPANKGDGPASTMAKAVLEAFPIGGSLTYGTTSVRIEKSYRKDGVPEPDWYGIPVVINWRAD